jgi:uncharacterized YigZ family protein
MKDTYQTIAEPSTGEFKDRGSKFIAFAYPACSNEDCRQRLEEVRKAHPKARHHCYAFRLGLDGNNYRANDDGEPSGTAGRPILGQVDRFGLTNIIVVVVRYFGGTLLGTSGLINAYKTSAADALEQAAIIEKTVEVIYRLTFDYALMSDVMNAVKKLELEMVRQDFGTIGILEVAIRQGSLEEMLNRLKALIAKIRFEEVAQLEEIEGLKLEYVYTR